jgi:hypothetical protein
MSRERWPTVPRDIAVSIAEAVEREGGDYTDVEDLLDVWERVNRRNAIRADVILREAASLASVQEADPPGRWGR